MSALQVGSDKLSQSFMVGDSYELFAYAVWWHNFDRMAAWADTVMDNFA
jgi:hypothetical protein